MNNEHSNDHNLPDLIAEVPTPAPSKPKSPLTIFALVIIILVLAIIFSKNLLKSPQDADLLLEDNSSSYIAPELQVQSFNPNQEEDDETELVKAPSNFSQMIENRAENAYRKND
ncbi:MAG: hypothetical protein Q9M36_12945 [Sulfurovum sp.]|nr:hypothetical protein [Sulfurovum sp.]